MANRRNALVVAATVVVAVCGGCECFPPTPPPGVGGATELATLGGGRLGAARAYVVGAEASKIGNPAGDQAALTSSLAAETRPAVLTEKDVANADLNSDGFITLDEIVAMKRVGLSETEIGAKVVATGYVMGATRPQMEQLTKFGVGEIPELLGTGKPLSTGTGAAN